MLWASVPHLSHCSHAGKALTPVQEVSVSCKNLGGGGMERMLPSSQTSHLEPHRSADLPRPSISSLTQEGLFVTTAVDTGTGIAASIPSIPKARFHPVNPCLPLELPAGGITPSSDRQTEWQFLRPLHVCPVCGITHLGISLLWLSGIVQPSCSSFSPTSLDCFWFLVSLSDSSPVCQ